MATTYTYGGSRQVILEFLAVASVDQTGTTKARVDSSRTFAAAGGADPDTSGYLKGALSVSGSGDILLAHATDPLQSFGDATYSPGFTVAGAKIKAIYLKNTAAAGNLTVARAAAAGCPIFDGAEDSVVLQPGDVFYREFAAGTAALTTGANDAVTLTASAGTVTADLWVVYGP